MRLSLLALVLASCFKPSNSTGPAKLLDQRLDEQLPLDDGVQSGTLDNGLTWYIEENQRPLQRAELRLVVRAGSILEDDDQRGLAHVVEHMAFNGTTSFPGTEMVTWLEAQGIPFGAHINASTSFDETLYQLRVPTDDPVVFDKSVHILSQWAQGLTFDADEIEAERGVILEEWRTTQGLGERIREPAMRAMFGGSKYVERPPIGTEHSLKTFERDALIRFYNDWYRPDLMSVVAVGDFDADEVQALIERHFGDLSGPATSRERTFDKIPGHEDMRVIVITDKEIPRTQVGISARVDDVEGNTHRAYRDLLSEWMAVAMLNDRLSVLAQDEPELFGASIGYDRLTPVEKAWSASAVVSEGTAVRGVELLERELERVRRHGFLDSELNRAGKAVLSSYEGYLAEMDKTDSRTHAAEIVRVITTGEAMPGIEYEVMLARQWLPRIDVEEVNAWTEAHFFPPNNRVIQVVQPEKEGLAKPQRDELLAAVDTAVKAELDALIDEVVDAPLMEKVPEPGEVVKEEALDDAGAVLWTLSNGARVVIKTTNFQNDQVVMRAWSPGGTSQVSDDRWKAVRFATSIMSGSGMGQHDPRALSKVLSGSQANVSPSIGTYSDGISGSAAASETDLLLQLTHMAIAEPRFDHDAYDRLTAVLRESLRNRDAAPSSEASDRFTQMLWQDHARHTPMKLADLDAVSLKDSEAFYRERFGDMSDFVFVLVGNVDPDDIKPDVERYLASLPGSERPAEVPRDLGDRMPNGPHKDTVRAGSDPRGSYSMQLHGAFDDSPTSRHHLSSMLQVLDLRLRESLREERSGTYGVNVSHGVWRHPTVGWRVSISFQCDPSRVEELETAMWSELARLRDEPVTDEEIERIQALQRRASETGRKSNGWWLSVLVESMRRGLPPADFLQQDKLIDALDASSIQKAAKQHLSPDNYVQIVWLPEE
ncbi:MAG: zinc protease [Kiritimatiellia bacterium]